MNMNDSPGLDELRHLICRCNDHTGSHLLWIDRLGRVTVTCLSQGETPAIWARKNQSQLAVRLESMAQGKGFVGPTAAADDSYLRGLLAQIQEAWENSGFSRDD